MKYALTSLGFAAVFGVCLIAWAADDAKGDEVLGGLSNPCGVSIRP